MAKANAQRADNYIARINRVKLVQAGTKGFLGLGRTPNQYEIQYTSKAAVYIAYRSRAKIALTVGSAYEGLNSPDRSVRGLAIFKLGQSRDPNAVEPLIELFQTESDASNRGGVVKALGYLGDMRAAPPLIEALKHAHRGDGFDDIVHALGRLGDKKAALPLVEALCNSSGFNACQDIAEALIKIGDTSVIPALSQALSHSDSNVTRFAKEAINGLMAQDPVAAIKGLQAVEVEVRREAAKAARDGGAQTVEPLIHALRDSDREVQGNAANSLVTLYQSGELDESVRQNIAAQHELHNLINPQCAICGKALNSPAPHHYDSGLETQSFCSDACWDRRGRVIGSQAGSGCPYYNADRMCVPPVPGAPVLPCSLGSGSYSTSCFVYSTHRPRQ